MNRTFSGWRYLRPTLLAAVVILALGSIGWIFAQTEDDAGSYTALQGAAPQDPSAAEANEVLKNFLTHAYYHERASLSLAELASARAVGQKVKEFAGNMITDHHATDYDLFALAKKKRVAIDQHYRIEENPLYQTMLAELAKLSGLEFDVAYMEQTVENCKLELQQYLHLAGTATDGETQLFAAQQVSRARGRLVLAQKILHDSQGHLTAHAL